MTEYQHYSRLITKICWCVINNKPDKCMYINDIDREITKLTMGSSIRDHFTLDNEELALFLKKRTKMFKLLGRNQVRAIKFSEKEEFSMNKINGGD